MKIIIDSQQVKQKGENMKIDLQNIIDNRNDEYGIFLREISYCVGYFNISDKLRNNRVRYYNGTGPDPNDIFLPSGLYTVQQYFDMIKLFITNADNDASKITFGYHDNDGKISIQVTPPYTFTILKHNMRLLGFKSAKTITGYAISDNPVNFMPNKMLYIHLKQLKNNNIYFNGNRSDILANVPVTSDAFGSMVHHKFDLPYINELDNTTITSLDLSITDKNNNLIDFHNMPVYYVLEVCKK
jgi:hypothetical protein